MLARVRLSVPDRPGSLGLITSTIGATGADIEKIDVLASESGRALDDVFLRVRDRAHLAGVTARLGAAPGVQVVGAQAPAPPATGHADLELLAHVLRSPERGLQTLVDGAPHAFGADWAHIVEYAQGEFAGVVAGSTHAPAELLLRASLRLTALQVPTPEGDVYGGAALAPIGSAPLGLVLVRVDGPQFHASELWRVAQIGSIVATALAPV